MRSHGLVQKFGIGLGILWLCSSSVITASLERRMPIVRELPLNFEPGPAISPALFVAHSANLEIRLRPLGFDLIANPHVDLAVQFVDANAKTTITGGDRRVSESNYFMGSDPSKWRTHVPNFGSVRYADIYPGIDLIFYGNRERLEHDFVLGSGADPHRIRLRISGQETLSLEPDGNLKLGTSSGNLLFQAPRVYQLTPKGKRYISGRFLLVRGNEVGFAIGDYDRSLPLVIDPVLTYSTYLAGSGREQTAGAIADSSGNVYVTGITTSADFPTQSAEQPTCGITPCAATFLTKLNPSGDIVYSTYLAGTGNFSSSIAVDPSGNVIVGGYAESSTFPTLHSYATFGCCNLSYAFVLSVAPDGSQLNYSSLLGKIALGTSVYVAVDQAGAAYATGQTDDTAFPITPGLIGTSIPGYPYEALFVTKLKNDGTILYSTPVPGTLPISPYTVNGDNFIPGSIAVDSNGNAYIGGEAGPGLPTTTGVISTAFPNDPSSPEYFGFILKLNPTASALTYATYLPGTSAVTAVALDPNGQVFAAGAVLTSFQATPGAFQTRIPAGTNCTCNGGFVAHLNSGATAYLAATYLTGTPAPSNEGTDIESLALDASGNIWAAGITASQDFPLRDPIVNLFPPTASRGAGFVAELAEDLTTDVFSTFLTGQTGNSGAYNLFVAPIQQGVVWVAGATDDSDFPTTSSAFQRTLPSSTGGSDHTFISKIDTTVAAASTCLSAVSLGFVNAEIGVTSAPESITIQNCGNAVLHVQSISISNSVFSETSTCLVPIPPGSSCVIMVTFSPSSLVSPPAVMTITDDSSFSPKTITLGGYGAFSVTPAGTGPLSETIEAGQTANYSISVNAGPLFGGTVRLSCTQVPANFTCSITPPGVLLSPGASQYVSVSISAPSSSATRIPSFPCIGCAIGVLVFLSLAFARHFQELFADSFVRFFVFATLLLAICVIPGCGGGADPSNTSTSSTTTSSTGTYTVLIVASDGSASESLPLALTVQ